jgi:hypothetical protein
LISEPGLSPDGRRPPRPATAPPARLPAFGGPDILATSASVPDRLSDAVPAAGTDPPRERRLARPPSTSPSFGAGLFSTAAINSRSSSGPIESSVCVHSCGRYSASLNAKIIRSPYCASPRGSNQASTMARAASSRSVSDTGSGRAPPPGATPARRRASATLTLREFIAAARLLLISSIESRVERVPSPRCCATRSAWLLSPATPSASCARLSPSSSAPPRADSRGVSDPGCSTFRELRRERASSPSIPNPLHRAPHVPSYLPAPLLDEQPSLQQRARTVASASPSRSPSLWTRPPVIFGPTCCGRTAEFRPVSRVTSTYLELYNPKHCDSSKFHLLE